MAQPKAVVTGCSQSQNSAKPQAVVSTPQPRKITLKEAPSFQQVWVSKSSQPTKHQSQHNKAGNSSAPLESVFSRLGQKSIFSRLGSKISLDSLKIFAPD
jgi:hypothetical protein